MIVSSSLIGILVESKERTLQDGKIKRLQRDKNLLRALVLASS
jgi:hypothetical protein